MPKANVRAGYYRDTLACRKRRFFILKLIGFSFLALAALVGAGYLLFFSPVLAVNSINVEGIRTIDRDAFYARLSAFLDESAFKYLKLRRNILFLNAKTLSESLESQFPVAKEIAVSKEIPHRISVRIQERSPIGIWCISQECFYFDEEGKTWSGAVKSSGFLLISVEDERQSEIDDEYFSPVLQVVRAFRQSDIKIKQVVIPADAFREFHVESDRGYILLFSLDSDIPNQLEVLRIFLDEKSKDPDFHPRSLDLRIDGRVYYR